MTQAAPPSSNQPSPQESPEPEASSDIVEVSSTEDVGSSKAQKNSEGSVNMSKSKKKRTARSRKADIQVVNVDGSPVADKANVDRSLLLDVSDSPSPKKQPTKRGRGRGKVSEVGVEDEAPEESPKKRSKRGQSIEKVKKQTLLRFEGWVGIFQDWIKRANSNHPRDIIKHFVLS